MAKDKVYLPITSCEQCPFCDRSWYYTSDSIENFLDSACSTLSLDDPEDRRTCAQNLAEWIFEHVVAWNCTHPKLRRKKNAHTDREKWKSPPGIARRDLGDKPPSIPEWCPLRKKEKA